MKQKMTKAFWLIAISLLSLMLFVSCASQKAEDISADSAIVLTGINSPIDAISTGKTDALKSTVKWISDNAKTHNIGYVSFIGRFTTDPADTYADYTKNKKDIGTIIDKNKADKKWMGQFNNLKNVLSVLESSSLPYGLTYAAEDNYGMGGYRKSNYSEIYDANKAISGKTADFVAYNAENYYSIIESQGQKFIVFQLESMPTTPVIEWFNTVMAEKCDHRAIVFTESLIDATGEFWQMWDWASGYPYKAENRGNTKLKNFNLLWTDKPNDGITLWNASFVNHDNLILIVTSNADTTEKIAFRKEKTAGGCDVAILAGKTGNNALMVSISKDNKTIKAGYVDSKGKCIKDSYIEIGLEKLSELKPPVNKSIPTKIGMHPNGANTAYISSDSDKFEPDKTITRGEAIDAVATLIGKHPEQVREENRFTDIDKGDALYDSVNYLDSQGHLDYITDEKIALNTAMTRGELAQLLYSASNILDSYAFTIADVSEDDELFYEYAPIVASGYMELDKKGNFNPSAKVTRADFVTVMNKVIGLKANEKTIDVALLDNTFTDIAGHEAEYDILAATNDNVEAPYHKDIKTDGITETDDAFILDNKLATITIEKDEAHVASIIDKKTGEDILFSGDSLISMDSPATRSNYPVTMERDGSRFKFTFEHGEIVYMIIEVHDTFFTFELDTELPINETALNLCAFDTAEEFSTDPESVRLSGMVMNTNTYTEYYGGGEYKMTGATVTKGVADTMGAKYGVVVSEYSDFVKAMQDMADDVDPDVGITNKSGGAYSSSNPSTYGDYCIVSSIDLANIDKDIETAVKYNLKQIDLHQGGSSFIQGDYIEGEGFRFPNIPSKTASEFKTLVADKYHEAGLELGLHIYSFYISPSAVNVLSVPEYQQQLEYSETYTLANDLSKSKPKVDTVEDCSGFDLDTSFTYKNSKYILIDQEIMLVEKVDSSGMTRVLRGQCGTEAQEHKAGTEIRHLIHYYGMFAPIVGSDLFYNVAEWVAETYNKGGFDMIYFDAHDGLGKHTTEQWYYGAEFVRTVISNCENAPIVELSTHYPTLWAARSRLLAYDTPTRGYKQFNLNHLNANKAWMDRMYPTTFGWFNYAPDISYPEKNTLAKTIFRDDLDHMGSLAIAWNVSTVYNNFSAVKTSKVMSSNIEYYNVYNKLRLDGYFTEEVRKQIREGKYEYKLVKNDKNEWAFREMHYSKGKIYDAEDEALNKGKGNNPFDAQAPYIRIESRYSTEFEQEKVILDFAEPMEITSVAGTRDNMDIPNLTNAKAIKVRVYGNGSDTDAIMITLTYTGPGEYEYTDYVVPLNFDGWKDIVLVDSDCADYGYTFSSRNVNTVSWDTFREIPNYAKLNGIVISTTGNCEGVLIDDIVAYKHIEAPVKNPCVTVGNETITFNTEIKGGEYIEYDPDTKKAVLNHNDGNTENITYSGSLTVPAGDFEFTYSATPLTEAPIRAQVVFGCGGNEIAN